MRGVKRFSFNTALVFGCVVALLLLLQSIAAYFYVLRRIERDRIERDDNRLAVGLERDTRQHGVIDAAGLGPILDQLSGEENASRKAVAWLRLLDPRGRVLAQSGDSVGPVPNADALRGLLAERKAIHRVQSTEAGRVSVDVAVVHIPMRSSSPEPDTETRVRTGPLLLEMGLYEDAGSGRFGIVRLNFLISCAAALMLLGAMLALARGLKAYLRGQRTEQELAIARSVQRDLLPLLAPFYGELECAGICEPAWQVGGDFYDIFRLPSGATAVVVGDVAGKGLGAAMIMSLLHGAIRCSNWWGGAAHEAATQAINQALISGTAQHTFATLFWGYYEDRTFYYLNAGHCPPMLLRRSAERKPEADEHLTEGGPVVGLLSDVKYCQGKVTLEAGDLLVLPSDGVLEAEDLAGEQFGEDRLRAVVRQNENLSCEAICERVLKSVETFTQDQRLADDLTVVIVRALENSPATQARLTYS